MLNVILALLDELVNTILLFDLVLPQEIIIAVEKIIIVVLL